MAGIVVALVIIFWFSDCFVYFCSEGGRQRGSGVRVGDLNTEDLGSNPRLGLPNGFVLGDTRGKFTTLCK